MGADERWIARSEALNRLGVKAQTLYAYVSRGRIAARPDPTDSRKSLYAVCAATRSTAVMSASCGRRACVRPAWAQPRAARRMSIPLYP
jgi:hypothetical protein